jgi:hypothetical protein
MEHSESSPWERARSIHPWMTWRAMTRRAPTPPTGPVEVVKPAGFSYRGASPYQFSRVAPPRATFGLH